MSQTRSNAIALFNTLPAFCNEKVAYMKTGEELWLTPNLHHGRQDPSHPEVRTSADHQSERSARYEETRRGNVDYRIQGKPHSAVQKEDSYRKEIVKRLIQQFETHANRGDSLIEHLNETEENQSVQRKVEGVDHQHCYHAVLRAVRDLF